MNKMNDNEMVFERCGGWLVKGRDEVGIKYAKTIDCGREWCPVCGERTQMRRFSRILPKAQKIKSMGYLIVSYPPELRHRVRTQEGMKKDRELLIEALEVFTIVRFLGRTHLFGQENPGVFQPHHNILFEGGRLELEELELFKEVIRGIMGFPDNSDIWYQYSEKVSKKIHWLKYINKNTFLDWEWDEELAKEFRNFKNSFSRGNVRNYTGEWKTDKNGKRYEEYFMDWSGEVVWELEKNKDQVFGYVASILRGVSPVTGGKIRWYKIVKKGCLNEDFFKRPSEGFYEEIWDGVYQVNPPVEVLRRYEALKILDKALFKEVWNDKS